MGVPQRQSGRKITETVICNPIVWWNKPNGIFANEK
jgi:hypothetical protein